MSDSLEDMARTMRSIDTTLKELAAFLAMGKKGIANETHALALLIELGPDIAAIADRIGCHCAGCAKRTLSTSRKSC